MVLGYSFYCIYARLTNSGLKHTIFFHKNYPIRFVCVIGPVVAFGDVYAKHGIFYIEDGSGRNIAVKLRRLSPEDVTPQAPSNTTVSNVNISASLGRSDIEVAGTILDIGTVVKLKCTIDVFRDSKQLILQRALVLKSTTEEAREWEILANWTSILSKPWVIGPNELAVFEKQFAEENLLEGMKKQKRIEHAKAREKRNHDRSVHKESKRRKLEAEMDTGALI
jgi:Telomere regulation protein Stn1